MPERANRFQPCGGTGYKRQNFGIGTWYKSDKNLPGTVVQFFQKLLLPPCLNQLSPYFYELWYYITIQVASLVIRLQDVGAFALVHESIPK
jgi:hypothetical protein